MSARKRELNEQLDRLEQELPHSAAKPVRHLRKPGMSWLRVPVALLLIIGGLLWFLPVLGLWMLPLGLALIALDVPFLHRPMTRFIAWGLAKWSAWRGKTATRHQGRRQGQGSTSL